MRLSTIISTIFIITLFISSCGKQGVKCKFTNCPENSVCMDGDCLCNPGYEGDDCNILIREKILGTYKGTMKTKYQYNIAPNPEQIKTDVVITITESGAKDVSIGSDFYQQPISCEVSYSNNSFNSIQTGEEGELQYQLNVNINNGNISYSEEKHGHFSRSFQGVKQ